METSLNHWKDRLGIIASILCAVHCAATPILLAFLPALTFTEWMASPRFHQIAAIVCVAMVSLAIWPAFRKFKDYRVLSLSTMGLSLLIAAAFILPDECCTQSISSMSNVHPDAENDHAGHVHASYDHASHTSASVASVSVGHSNYALASVVSPELIALVQPWMTPLGGLLLVVAHGLNIRRKVCTSRQCKCHGDKSVNRIGASGLRAVETKAA